MASQSRTIKVKFDGDAKDLARATKAAERAVAGFGESGGRSFTSSFKKWLTGRGAKDMEDSGRFGASVFGSGLLGALKTPVLGPAIAAVLTAAVATALPAVGAVAAGGLIAGFGAGLAGLGLVFAAKNEEVKKVWSDTMTDLGRDMELLAEPFEDTLIAMAGFFRRTVDAFNPHLAKAFAKMAGPIEDFADDAAKALEELIPAIDPITDAFNEVLGSLGPALQNAIGDVTGGLIELADSVKANPEALADLVEGIGTLVTETLGLITTLNDINGTFTEITGGMSLVDIAIGTLTTGVAVLKGSFDVLGGVLGGINRLIHDQGKEWNDNSISAFGAAGATDKAAGAAQHASPKVQTLAEKIQAAKQAAAEAKQRFEEWITSMFKLQNQSLTLSGAQISLQAAIDNASASVKENGRTLDLNTEKGRANRTALNNVASAANAQTEAFIRAGGSTETAASKAATAKQNFVNLATQMGLSKKAAEALATALIAIPNVSRTVTVRTVTVGGVRQDQGVDPRQGGHTPTERRARGGPVFSGRSYLVGENGPEVLTVGAHGQGHITPNHQLGGDTHVYVTIDGQQLQGRITKTVRDGNRAMKRAVTAGALRGAPA